MGFFQKTISAFSRKWFDLSAFLSAFQGESSGEAPRSLSGRYVQGFRRNGVGYSAINMMARTFSGVPWVLYMYDTQGERIEVVDRSHPLNRILRRPNPKQGRAEFFERISMHLSIAGCAYIFKAKGEAQRALGDGSEKSIHLHLLMPNCVRMKDQNKPDSDYIYKTESGEKTYKYEDVLKVSNIDPLDEIGHISPLEPAALSVQQSNLSREWNSSVLARDARPAGLLTTSSPIVKKEDADKILNQFEAKFGGSGNAGRPIFLRGDVKWERISASPSEMEWLEGMRAADRTTCTAIGVSSQLLGDKEGSTFSNVKEARAALYQDQVIPLLRRVRDSLNAWLAPEFGDNLELDIDVDEIDALQEDRSQAWSRVSEADFLSLNEKREALKYERIEGPAGDMVILRNGIVVTGDGEILVPLSLQTIESAVVDSSDVQDVQNDQTTKPQPGGAGGDPNADPQSDGGSKFFGLTTDEQKGSFWASIDKDRQRFESAVTKGARRIFDRQGRAVAAAVKGASSVQEAKEAVGPALAKSDKEWRKLYRELYVQTGTFFGAKAAAEIRKNHKPKKSVQVKDLKPLAARLRAALEDYSESIVDRKIQGIQDFSARKVGKILDLGIFGQESTDKIVDEIAKVFVDQARARAETIAVTETVAATNAGISAGAQAVQDDGTGPAVDTLLKEWITQRDDRVRDMHREADGQSVPHEDAFTVGGEKLQFPGDSSLGASPDNTINCRCYIQFTEK